MLTDSDTRSHRPFKGRARFYAHNGQDIAWVYDHPIPECPQVKGLIAFFDEHVDITIDDEPQPRPFTPWSSDPRA